LRDRTETRTWRISHREGIDMVLKHYDHRRAGRRSIRRWALALHHIEEPKG
jgi:hypothetical protein